MATTLNNDEWVTSSPAFQAEQAQKEADAKRVYAKQDVDGTIRPSSSAEEGAIEITKADLDRINAERDDRSRRQSSIASSASALVGGAVNSATLGLATRYDMFDLDTKKNMAANKGMTTTGNILGTIPMFVATGGAGAAAGLGRAGILGAEALVGGVGGELTNANTEGRDFSLKNAAIDTAANFALGGLLGIAGKAAKSGAAKANEVVLDTIRRSESIAAQEGRAAVSKEIAENASSVARKSLAESEAKFADELAKARNVAEIEANHAKQAAKVAAEQDKAFNSIRKQALEPSEFQPVQKQISDALNSTNVNKPKQFKAFAEHIQAAIPDFTPGKVTRGNVDDLMTALKKDGIADDLVNNYNKTKIDYIDKLAPELNPVLAQEQARLAASTLYKEEVQKALAAVASAPQTMGSKVISYGLNKAKDAVGNAAAGLATTAGYAIGGPIGGAAGGILGSAAKSFVDKGFKNVGKTLINPEVQLAMKQVGNYAAKFGSIIKPSVAMVAVNSLHDDLTKSYNKEVVKVTKLNDNIESVKTQILDQAAEQDKNPEDVQEVISALDRKKEAINKAFTQDDPNMLINLYPHEVSASEMSKRKRKLKLITDENYIMDLTENNQICKEDVDFFKETNPGLYNVIQKQAFTYIQESNQSSSKVIPYDKRVALTTLTGMPVEPTSAPAAVATFQSAWKSIKTQQKQQSTNSVNSAKALQNKADRTESFTENMG